MTDGTGNTVVIKQVKKMSKREEKLYVKALREKIAKNEDLDEDEEEYAYEHNLFA